MGPLGFEQLEKGNTEIRENGKAALPPAPTGRICDSVHP
jgi:hypothetical protein